MRFTLCITTHFNLGEITLTHSLEWLIVLKQYVKRHQCSFFKYIFKEYFTLQNDVLTTKSIQACMTLFLLWKIKSGIFTRRTFMKINWMVTRAL